MTLTTLMLPHLHAQDDGGGIAYTSPKLPDDPNLAKVSMFRLWYLGTEDAPPVCLAIEQEGRKPEVLEGNLNSGLISSYVPMKPGRLKVHILDNSALEFDESTEAEAFKEKRLSEPLEIALRPGGFSTLIVTESPDSDHLFLSTVIEDERPQGNAPVMQVRNFALQYDWKIRLLDREGEFLQDLWNSKSGAQGESIRLPGAGVFRVEVTKFAGGEPLPCGLFETQLAKDASFTILLYRGYGSEGTSDLIFNAAPGYFNAEQVARIADAMDSSE